jgi:pyridoxine 5-phosphate synthase
LEIACRIAPDQATLVPERREEVTTEGGLDVVGHRKAAGEAIRRLRDAGVTVSLFLDPDARQIEIGRELGADAVELHTGCYANAAHGRPQTDELLKLAEAGAAVRREGLVLHAGHGLTYRNVKPVAALDGMTELNIGHSIVARAVMIGFQQAVREMKDLISH